MTEHVEHGFGPVWDAESRVLVLGSMPSPKSREASFYYMHPRNRFWPVMAAVFADPADPEDAPGDTPDSRRAFALRHGIALWDVIAECDIDGASDASIANVVPNDPVPLIRGSRIALVATTGASDAAVSAVVYAVAGTGRDHGAARGVAIDQSGERGDGSGPAHRRVP